MLEYKFAKAKDKDDTKNSDRENVLQHLNGLGGNFEYQDIPEYNPEDKLNLDRLEAITKTEDDLKNQATSELEEYKNSSMDAINSNSENKKNDFLQAKDNEQKGAVDQKVQLSSIYEQRKESASQDALKRGLARSSIIINKIEAFDNQKIAQYNEIDKTLTENVNKLNYQIDVLETQKENALKNFDISYAAKINEKITKYKENLNKANTEIIKYNNDIEKQEKEYEAKRLQDYEARKKQAEQSNQYLADYIAKWGSNAVNKQVYDQKFTYANNYLSGMSKKEAYAELTDFESQYRAALGDKLYGVLLHNYKV